jgi:hypothetical protein
MSEIKYSNWYTKLLFGKAFQKQHFIQIPPSFIEKWLIHSIEKYKFNKDLSKKTIVKPVFIIGLPRSGTTLLYNLLCAHEKSGFITNSMNAYPEAPCTIEWLRKKFSLNIEGERFFKDSIITDFSSPSEPILFWGKWAGREHDNLFWDEQRISDLAPGKPAEIYNDVNKILSCFDEENLRFVCKYPVAQTELRLIQDLFPDAKFIHIIRDGRQVANSLIKLNKISNEQLVKINHPEIDSIVTYPRVKNLVKYIDEYGVNDIRTTSKIWQESIDLVNATKEDLNYFTEIKYEDLLINPEKEMDKIFDFCEMDKPDIKNEKYKAEFSKIGKISHKNNYGDFEIVEEYAERVLKEYNYLPSI